MMSRLVMPMLLVAACFGCGGDETPPRALDLSAGTYGGVGIGSSTAEVRAAFGDGESAPDGPAAPLDEEFSVIGGALSIPMPKGHHATRNILRYDDVAFLLVADRVYALVATAGGPVGEELQSVREQYPVKCDTTEGGGEYREWPYCVGKLNDRRFVWFGEDPIRSITVSETSLLGGA